jgi:C-terminal processing protease CtpA/Prc
VSHRSAALMIPLLLAVVHPAWAGSKGKCSYTTQECLDTMSRRIKSGGWVGVEIDQNEATHLWVVTKVVAGSPAESAGIQIGDVLYALNGIEIKDENEEDLARARKEWKPGQLVQYTIKRNGADRQVALTLAPMPADLLARWIGQHMLEHATVESASEVTRK